MTNSVNVAIDGPAGAGKSTVAKQIAKRLGFLYIDTGAMYRTLTYAALREGVSVHDGQALYKLLEGGRIELDTSGQGANVFWNETDVTEAIRSNEVNANVSAVASHEPVRRAMVQQQQLLATKANAVLDGRDVGTHVLPHANLKVFLTASVLERAKRRYEEQLANGMDSDFELLKREIAMRDELDSTREVAPLQKAEDAVELDTTLMTFEEVVETIYDLVKERTA
ncbi:(d)CMP kinase [Shouchella shacheensis]|uniref:(d)CMP kinase n=1 Tax=Shouchella shacheensis TaxID=1649580 RepID=UPI0007404C02|nr:(d)CMP kinase [Shouchella shacheensis]